MTDQVIQCSTQCTVTVEHVISIPPLSMPMETGFQIGTAIFAVWTVAFCIKLLARVFEDASS